MQVTLCCAAQRQRVFLLQGGCYAMPATATAGPVEHGQSASIHMQPGVTVPTKARAAATGGGQCAPYTQGACTRNLQS